MLNISNNKLQAVKEIQDFCLETFGVTSRTFTTKVFVDHMITPQEQIIAEQKIRRDMFKHTLENTPIEDVFAAFEETFGTRFEIKQKF